MPRTATKSCDVCRQVPSTGLRTWRRRMPAGETADLCAPCSYRLTRSADGRGRDDEDMMHMAMLYGTLAGEVWADREHVYWFRQPFVHREPVRMTDLLDRERIDTQRFSETTRRELARAGVRL